MLKIFYFLNFFFLLNSCTYQYNNTNNINIENIKKVYLNVKSFEINKDNLQSVRNDNILHYKINNRVLKDLETWAWKKFTIKGKQNVAYLNLLKIDTSLIEKSKGKKSIVSITGLGKEIYNIALNFDLSITNNQGTTKTLKISSNLDFVLLDRHSITQRDKIITYNVNKLIQLIDNKINVQLNKDTFKKLIIK